MPAAASADFCLMPWPRDLRATGETVAGAPGLRVHIDGVDSKRLRAAAARVAAGDAPPALPLHIRCAQRAPDRPGQEMDETYVLRVERSAVHLDAATEWGALRGLATLAQLRAADGPLPCLEIRDQPRFAWRGVLLDVARHFIGIEALLRTLDAMWLFKLNVLHLHLSDDQAFRFPSTRYPRLSSTPCYSREELARLVRYASDLGIRVVPELDMPGHTTSWLLAYPEWGAGPVVPSRRFGVHKACLDPSNPAVYEAVDVLLGELAEVFPDPVVHIGGDEVHPAWWSEQPRVQRYMREQGIADVAGLQAHFSARVAALARGHQRRVVGWDEVLHAGLPAEVMVQTWRGATARDRALRGGHDCVVSANYYLDLFYPAELHYRFDPEAPEAEALAAEDALLRDPRIAHVAEGLRWTHQWRAEAAAEQRDDTAPGRLAPGAAAAGAARPRGRVIGAEACLWAELVDEACLDVRLWSRLPALAERFWSAASLTDPADMYRRLRAAHGTLAAVGGIDLAARVRAALAAAGVQDPWLPLTDQLEPVKWYGRLLGEQALAARLEGREMPQARPYEADTPLDRVADALPPESFAARDLDALCRAFAEGDAVESNAARTRLEALAARWRGLPARGAGPDELAPLARQLTAIAELLTAMLAGTATAAAAQDALSRAARPQGEYLLAAAVVLAERAPALVARAGA
ncbi:MAG: family 20 glycosylhydrolase [Pseudomonadales bacterium]